LRVRADEPTFASDYKTEAEAGGFKKKTKKAKKRLRAKSAEPEEEGGCAAACPGILWGHRNGPCDLFH